MHVRPPTGTPVPTTSPKPLPVPPRWHLRTQVSRKTLFELIHDTLPPSALQVMDDSDAIVLEPDASDDAVGAAPAGTDRGGLPQSYLDSLAATIPMPLHPAALWNDGDTKPDLPDHWRPITITLASTAALPPSALPPPPPVPAARFPLNGAAKTAGWMLSGAALTFLISAAAFGGKPMLRAIRGGMVPQAQTTPDGPIPARQTAPALLPVPARAPAPQPSRAIAAGATVVAIADRPDAKSHPIVIGIPSSTGTDPAMPAVMPVGEAGLDDHGDRRSDVTFARPSHRARQDRRLARSATFTEGGRTDPSLLGADDAVMPLESAAMDARAETFPKAPAVAKAAPVVRTPVVNRSAAMYKTISSRVFRPIDVEDPFGGQ